MSGESLVVSKKSSYRDLNVWRKAITLAKDTYFMTEDFPKREHFGLALQMRRAATSIASNIAEGAARHSNKEFLHFLVIARGSLAELMTQIEIASEVGFLEVIHQEKLESQCNEISKMLSGLRSRLTTNN